jgi:hypothetical protein
MVPVAALPVGYDCRSYPTKVSDKVQFRHCMFAISSVVAYYPQQHY